MYRMTTWLTRELEMSDIPEVGNSSQVCALHAYLDGMVC
jgi:hypothetical protein